MNCRTACLPTQAVAILAQGANRAVAFPRALPQRWILPYFARPALPSTGLPYRIAVPHAWQPNLNYEQSGTVATLAQGTIAKLTANQIQFEDKILATKERRIAGWAGESNLRKIKFEVAHSQSLLRRL